MRLPVHCLALLLISKNTSCDKIIIFGSLTQKVFYAHCLAKNIIHNFEEQTYQTDNYL